MAGEKSGLKDGGEAGAGVVAGADEVEVLVFLVLSLRAEVAHLEKVVVKAVDGAVGEVEVLLPVWRKEFDFEFEVILDVIDAN